MALPRASLTRLACICIGILGCALARASTAATARSRSVAEFSCFAGNDLAQRPRSSFLMIRGGASDDESEYDFEGADEYDATEEEDDEATYDGKLQETSLPTPSSQLTNAAFALAKKSLGLLGKATMITVNVMQRTLRAGFYPSDEETEQVDDDASLTTRIVGTLKRMVKAAFQAPKDGDDLEMPSISVTKKQAKPKKLKTEETVEDEPAPSSFHSHHDFGAFLSNTYAVPDERTDDKPVFMGGSFKDAVRKAREEARLLVVYIPLSRKPSKKADDPDRVLIQSLLSDDIVKAANKLGRKTKKGKGDSETGAFAFWGAKAGSSEANEAIKALKASQKNSKGQKRPILVIGYPAVGVSSIGAPVFVGRKLAQHHCSPPPNPSQMARWLEELRKRNAKQYHSMHEWLKEKKFTKERNEGYVESIQNDNQRQIREAKEKAERAAKEAEERARKEAVVARRAELLASLPEEDTSPNAKTIALRFADGRSTQRKFSPDERISTIFNYIDAEFEMERESINLISMNGRMAFVWDGDDKDKSLDEVGLKKMTAFRVMEKKPDKSSKGDEDDEEKES